MTFNREETRQRRIATIKESAPEDMGFEGFGGSAMAYETLCYTYGGWEIRIPVFPHLFKPDDVESEYGCLSGADWQVINDYLDES